MIYRITAAAFLTLCLAVIGLQAPSRAQFNGCSAGFCSKASGPSCVGFSIDGAATNTAAAITWSTTQINDVGILWTTINPVVNPPINSVSGSISGAWTNRGKSSATGNTVWEWTVNLAGTVTSDVVTISTNGAPAFIENIIFGVHGGHLASPFDPNLAGGSITAGASPVSLTTTNAQDLLISGGRNGGTGGTAQSGWTGILQASTAFTYAAFRQVTSAQSTLSVSDPNSGSNGFIVDALICGP